MKRQNGTAVMAGHPHVGTQRGKKQALVNGVVVGHLIALDETGLPRVQFSGSPEGGLPARTIVTLSIQQLGQQVALMFEAGDTQRPIIMGVLQSGQMSVTPTKKLQARIDGEAIVLTAEKEIVLKCGEASLTLTREGKIQLRGTYLVSRSSGVNRIQGGSIELN